MTPPPVIASRPRRNAWWWGGCLVALTGAAILFVFDPSTHGFYPRCLFHSTTGLYCPGCGALRGMHQLVHGHGLTALRMNPLVFLLLPAVGAVHLWRRTRVDDEPASFAICAKPLGGGLLLAIVILFWILRNIPAYPFAWLAP